MTTAEKLQKFIEQARIRPDLDVTVTQMEKSRNPRKVILKLGKGTVDTTIMKLGIDTSDEEIYTGVNASWFWDNTE